MSFVTAVMAPSGVLVLRGKLHRMGEYVISPNLEEVVLVRLRKHKKV